MTEGVNSVDKHVLSKEERRERVRYEILSSTRLRECIKERMELFIEHVHDRKVDALVFLDRSARPLSWLMRGIWKRRYPNEPVPETRFVNIGYPSSINSAARPLLSDIEISDAEWEQKHAALLGSVDDRWMKTSDLPEPWKQVVAQDTKLPPELADLFEGQFSAAHVLVVDELVASGKALSTALMLFERAFPKSFKWEGAGLFESDGVWRDADMFPWFRREGIAGVMELPNVDAIISAPLNETSVQAVRLEVQGKIAELEKIYPTKLQEAMLAVDLWLQNMEGFSSFSEDHRWRLKRALQSLKHRWSTYLVKGNQEYLTIGNEVDELYMCYRELFLNREKQDTDIAKQFYRGLEELVGPSSIENEIRTFRDILAKHADTRALIARSKQLRAEMDKLAYESNPSRDNNTA